MPAADRRPAGKIRCPIACAGVVVNPGDYIYGDRLGVVVVPPELAEETLARAQEIVEKETRTLEELRARLRSDRDG